MTPLREVVGMGSFGCTRSFHRVISGLNLTVTFCSCFRTHLISSDKPWTYGRVTVVCFSASSASVLSDSISWVGVGERGGAERRMKLVGKPFLFSTLDTWSSSFLLSAVVDDSALACDKKLFTTDFLWQRGWWDEKSRYLSVCVFLWYTDISIDPSELWVTRSVLSLFSSPWWWLSNEYLNVGQLFSARE